MPLNGDNCYLSVEGKDLQEIGKWTLIIMKKNNGHQGIICPFTGAFFHNMQTCLLVYMYNRSQVSVYRTIGPLVLIFARKHRLWVLVSTASARRF